MIQAFWRKTGGTLMREFPVVRASATCGARRLDAVILPRGEFREAHSRDVSLEGQDVIVVQAKASRLGMYLMGQAVFSAEIVRRFRPASVTFASNALAAGETPSWVARMLGHASPEMLFSVYARYIPNRTRRDGSALLSRMSGPSEAENGEPAGAVVLPKYSR